MTKRCQDCFDRDGQECPLLLVGHLVRSSLAISLSMQTCPVLALVVSSDEVAQMVLMGIVDARVVGE